MRRFAFALTASALGISLLANDFADAATCYTLQAELEHLQSQEGNGGSADRARYERAWREQANVLARTEGRARNAGCFGGGFLLFGRDPDPSCRMLVSKLRDMQDNLVRLDRLRRQGGNDNSRRIRQIRGAMANRGCGLPGSDQWDRPSIEERAFDLDSPYSGYGTFRTLCVRTCDGYYFPISYSTTQAQFGSDAQTCSAMCPGTEAKLYAYANPGGGPEDMRSIDGALYSDLPTAFQYRTSLNPSCSCKPAGGYSIIATNPTGQPAAEPAAEAFSAPLPRPRPAPGEDPETLANRAGHFVPRLAGESEAETAATGTAADGRSIRVVGPAHWGAEDGSGIVLTPVPN